jgi:hypothetical protein
VSGDDLGDDELLATILCALDDAAGFWRDQARACECSARDEPCDSCRAALTDADSYEHAYAVLVEGELEPEGRAVQVVQVRGARL